MAIKTKDHKIAQLKSQKEQVEASECTFKPHVSSFVHTDTSEVCKDTSLNWEAVEKFIKRQQAARCRKEESKIYEEFIRHGGSANVGGYAWKAHKQKYVKKSKSKGKNKNRKYLSKDRLFSFCEKEFKEVQEADSHEESKETNDSGFSTNKERMLMKEVEYLDWVVKATELEGKYTLFW